MTSIRILIAIAIRNGAMISIDHNVIALDRSLRDAEDGAPGDLSGSYCGLVRDFVPLVVVRGFGIWTMSRSGAIEATFGA
eukprot:scaffold7494_cov55-Attheya_sp.AAC.3